MDDQIEDILTKLCIEASGYRPRKPLAEAKAAIEAYCTRREGEARLDELKEILYQDGDPDVFPSDMLAVCSRVVRRISVLERPGGRDDTPRPV